MTTATDPTAPAAGTPAEPPASERDAIIEMIRRLPADATAEDIMYSLYIRQKIETGLKQLDAGQGIPHDEAMQRLAKWLS